MKKFFIMIMCALTITAHSNPITINASKEDITWLVKNVYFEARNQPTAGRIAVMMVTLNRVVDSRFPNTIKGVVTQGGIRLHKCQFSWYCDGKHDKIYDWSTYNDIQILVEHMLPIASTLTDITSGAVFYHANYVKPKWARVKKKIIQIGDHIFYK